MRMVWVLGVASLAVACAPEAEKQEASQPAATASVPAPPEPSPSAAAIERKVAERNDAFEFEYAWPAAVSAIPDRGGDWAERLPIPAAAHPGPSSRCDKGNAGVSPRGRRIVTGSGQSPPQSRVSAALTPAVAQAPVVQPRRSGRSVGGAGSSMGAG